MYPSCWRLEIGVDSSNGSSVELIGTFCYLLITSVVGSAHAAVNVVCVHYVDMTADVMSDQVGC